MSNLNDLSQEVVKWRKSKGFKTSWKNMPEKLMLVVTEVSEAMEAYRNNDTENFSSEISDCFIRLCDIVGSLNIDIENEIAKKMQINKNRAYRHGKIC